MQMGMIIYFVDYWKDNMPISLIDQQTSIQGRPVTNKSTTGWQICYQWKDGSTSWEKLFNLKESHPVQTVEFAVAKGIDHEPALNWWVKQVLKKRDRIIDSVRKQQSIYLKKSHKFGKELPKTVEHDIPLDTKNGKTLWSDAISKELENGKVVFEILPDVKRAPGHQFMQCHIIFSIKMEEFRCKVRLVAGGHMTKAPAPIMDACVVYREMAKTALMIAALKTLRLSLMTF